MKCNRCGNHGCVCVCSGDHTVKLTALRGGRCVRVLAGHRRTPWVVGPRIIRWITFLLLVAIALDSRGRVCQLLCYVLLCTCCALWCIC